jgi:hypothetical protein
MNVFRKVYEDIHDAVKLVNRVGLVGIDQVGQLGRIENLWTVESVTNQLIEQNDAETTYQRLYVLNGYFDMDEWDPETMGKIDDWVDRVQATIHALPGTDATDGRIDAYWAKDVSITSAAGGEQRDQPHQLAQISIEVHLRKTR